jgi:hypothetical protein
LHVFIARFSERSKKIGEEATEHVFINDQALKKIVSNNSIEMGFKN